MGHATQWKYRERQRLCGVHETSAGGPCPGAPDRTGACRCGIFRERFLEHLEHEGLPYIIVARLTAVVRKTVPASHTLNSLAWGGAGSGGDGSGGEFAELAGTKRRFCLAGCAPSHREFRLQRSWNGQGGSFCYPPDKIIAPIPLSLQLHLKMLPCENLYCGIRSLLLCNRDFRSISGSVLDLIDGLCAIKSLVVMVGNAVLGSGRLQ
jgi:hypothetical protein